MEKIKQNPFVKKVGFNRIVLCCVLLLMYGLFCALTGGSFAGMNRIMSALNYAYFLGFLSLGVTFVIATGEIDFSIGPVITSMASMNIAKGLASVYTKTQSVSWPQAADPDNGWFRNLVRYNGFPVGLVILLVAAVICAIILNKTRIGRYILCLGSNKEAVRLSGVDVKKWEMLAFIICGVLVGIGAIFYVSAYTTVQPGYGDQYNNEAIAGCVMGGTSMAGGLASISGTIIGVFIIALLQEGILALGFTKDYQLIITGVIVIVAVFSDVLARRRKN